MLAELAAGRLSLDTIKNGLPATRALDTAAEMSVSVPDIGETAGQSGCGPREPVAQFRMTIPKALIDKLAMVHFEIGHHERDDVLALLTALARVGRRPAISKTSDQTILSYSLPYRRDVRG